MKVDSALTRQGISIGDVFELSKPRIVVMALFATATGMALAPGTPSIGTWFGLMLGTALLVASANTLNMYLEREIDCLMARTSRRPLPTNRVAPDSALTIGILEACLAVPLLTFWINPLTGLLGTIAFLAYVNLYTPLKQRTSWAVLVGAVPGAMPALMGWTAMSNSLQIGGIAVFAFLFIWQIPHFHAIAMVRMEEYRAAGLKTLPVERGAKRTKLSIVFYLAIQLMVSLSLYSTGVAGDLYLAIAGLLGLGYFFYGVYGFFTTSATTWARKVFIFSIMYLPLVYIILLLDGNQ